MALPEDFGERRRDEEGRDIFERAVGRAAAIATQNVAHIHRVRLVTQAFIAAFITSAVIGLILALVFHHEAVTASQANSTYNCNLLRGITEPLAGFVANDAALREREQQLSNDARVVSGYQKIFGKTEVGRLYAESAALDRQATDYWKTQVVPRLNAVASVNCSARFH